MNLVEVRKVFEEHGITDESILKEFEKYLREEILEKVPAFDRETRKKLQNELYARVSSVYTQASDAILKIEKRLRLIKLLEKFPLVRNFAKRYEDAYREQLENLKWKLQIANETRRLLTLEDSPEKFRKLAYYGSMISIYLPPLGKVVSPEIIEEGVYEFLRKKNVEMEKGKKLAYKITDLLINGGIIPEVACYIDRGIVPLVARWED